MLHQMADWSLVVGSFGLILFSTVALRPPAPQSAVVTVTPVILATNR
ncbi:hypothetical protein [Phreatobacter sp.]|nr:hypothetical protein [Phreatobacter sp.]MCZ8316713.1 hypothetical protein [Phreatobacter sp.]